MRHSVALRWLARHDGRYDNLAREDGAIKIVIISKSKQIRHTDAQLRARAWGMTCDGRKRLELTLQFIRLAAGSSEPVAHRGMRLNNSNSIPRERARADQYLRHPTSQTQTAIIEKAVCSGQSFVIAALTPSLHASRVRGSPGVTLLQTISTHFDTVTISTI